MDPLFRICDGGLEQQLFSKAFRSACNSLLAENDADFTEFRKRFDKAQTEDIVRQVYVFMMSLPDPLRWLNDACADIPDHIDGTHPWFRTAERVIREKLKSEGETISAGDADYIVITEEEPKDPSEHK